MDGMRNSTATEESTRGIQQQQNTESPSLTKIKAENVLKSLRTNSSHALHSGTVETSQRLPTHERVSKTRHPHTMECYSALKRIKFEHLLHGGSTLKTLLSEISQAQQVNDCMTPLL